ncbi:cryptochrome/photolyase family protein [Xanthomonas oryzae]|uniref:cryptochrome/photolyase family protein n=1 Tax=Xanthomonas oryzae TaxID=347 RepID=UPI000400CE1B|nr:cryptochrome/photolyase family protein [Xanthomonas oryzae]ALS94227.1 deoxyribodipyrimidine photolyase [Xanthomonas oryzae pv. oryzae]AVT99828.1 cryptochrome/photolyase family protein [Xanthomonas oryzae pv. oryzae]AVU03509.1 cryptochrome/photolyase family protein [Xanthomonas oryzae pv. oryzae]KOR45529.1 deoxyribodipyrimidine photolyase [Xanthomonas oryzae]QBI16723.1 cryptochrome/photolyase family protein [Xanthomonas oryzae pv. oryzae]
MHDSSAPTAQTTQQTPAHTLRLILGDQLNPQHSWFATRDAGVVYVLMEVRQETDYVLHHAQKVLAIFAAMRAFAAGLRRDGHRVRYVTIDNASNRQWIPHNLEALMAHYRADRLDYQAPDEWRLDEALQHWSAAQPFATRMVDSEHFLTARNEVAACFRAGSPWRMDVFYRRMRRQHRILLDAAGEPEGGRWNFDHDNRAPWPGDPPAPRDWRATHDHSALWRTIEAAGVRSFGAPNAQVLPWPVDREEALQHLDAFIADALPDFGRYEDAMSTRSPRLFHSLLSFALNVKMLHPREVIACAEAAWRQGHAPLAAVEGFIRQILGWREYVRGVYWSQMPGYADLNHLDQHAPLPHWFWDGQIGMRCLADAVGNSLANAHAHHIQRLMVIGNFALLAGLDPQALHRWYLGVYIDAFEWVELPNTVGMSQFADGGLLGSKPYISGAAYIDRMSDYCSGCRYQRKLRVGANACPYNALYWDFLQRQRPLLGANERLALPYRQLDGMAPEVLAEVQAQAAHWRSHLEAL